MVASPPIPPSPTPPQARPLELRIRRASRTLEVDWDDGGHSVLPAEYLRVESPSAEVQGHHPSERKWLGGKRAVSIAAAEPIGHYAVRLRFTDGHDTGIYSWALLRQLAAERDARWTAYLEALARLGLDRGPDPDSPAARYGLVPGGASGGRR